MYLLLIYRPVGSRGAMAPTNLADHLILSQPGGADYAHQIIAGTPGF